MCAAASQAAAAVPQKPSRYLACLVVIAVGSQLLFADNPLHPPAPPAPPARADHRTKVNYDLGKVMEGAMLEDSIQSMIMLDQQEQLKEMMETASGA